MTRATTSVSNYDAQYYARRQSSPTLSAEIKAVTTLLDPRPVSYTHLTLPTNREV